MAGPPARKRTRGGTSGSNRGPASRTTGRRTRGGTGGSNRGPASRTTAPLANEICNLKFQILVPKILKKIIVRKFFSRPPVTSPPLFKREGGVKGGGGELASRPRHQSSHATNRDTATAHAASTLQKTSENPQKHIQKLHFLKAFRVEPWIFHEFGEETGHRFSTVKSRVDPKNLVKKRPFLTKNDTRKIDDFARHQLFFDTFIRTIYQKSKNADLRKPSDSKMNAFSHYRSR